MTGSPDRRFKPGLALAVFAPLLAGCLQRNWVESRRPLPTYSERPAAPLVRPTAAVEDAGGGGVIVRVDVQRTPRIERLDDWEVYKTGQFARAEANKAARRWLLIGAPTALVAGTFAGSASSSLRDACVSQVASGATPDNPQACFAEPQQSFRRTAGLSLLGVGVGAGVMFSSPWLPLAERSVRKDAVSSVRDQPMEPAAGAGVRVVLPGDGRQLGAATVGPSGRATVEVALPADVNDYQLLVEVDGVNRDEAPLVDLRSTRAWQERARAALAGRMEHPVPEGARQSLDLLRLADDPVLWSTWCEAFPSIWRDEPLAERTAAFDGDPSVPACRDVWVQLDAAWARRIDVSDPLARLEFPLETRTLTALPDPATRPALSALARCDALREDTAGWLSTDHPSDPELVEALDAERASAPPVAQACVRVLAAHVASEQRVRVQAAQRAQARCAAAVSHRRQSMGTLTSAAYGERMGRALVRIRDELQGRMRRMVAAGGPSNEQQDWVQCVVESLSSGDDIWRGIHQMNRGGYAEEWVERGQFGMGQESMLESVAEPGAACRSWVRARWGSSILGPIETYNRWSTHEVTSACSD